MINNDYLDRSYESVKKRSSTYTDLSTHCKFCGHTIVIVNVDRIVCNWCGHWVYKDNKTEFIYKMKEGLRKNGR